MTYCLLPLCALFLSFKTMAMDMSPETDKEDRNSIKFGSSPSSPCDLISILISHEREERKLEEKRLKELEHAYDVSSPKTQRRQYQELLKAAQGLTAQNREKYMANALLSIENSLLRDPGAAKPRSRITDMEDGL
jgi:hypothetical protein